MSGDGEKVRQEGWDDRVLVMLVYMLARVLWDMGMADAWRL